MVKYRHDITSCYYLTNHGRLRFIHSCASLSIKAEVYGWILVKTASLLPSMVGSSSKLNNGICLFRLGCVVSNTVECMGYSDGYFVMGDSIFIVLLQF